MFILHKKQRLFLTLPMLLVLGGCSLAPDYQRPEMPISENWPETYAPAPVLPGEQTAPTLGWRTFYTDPYLQTLIAKTLENNRDLRIAALHIERARALYQVQRADQIPNVNGGSSGTVQRLPADLSASRTAGITRQYSATVGLSPFELDFFGKMRNLSTAALESYLATEEARRSAHIALVSEVASSYLNLAADRERLLIATGTLASQQASYDMIQRRYEMGVSSELDLRQAQTSVDTARVDIARYTSQVSRDLNALRVLIGTAVTTDMLPAQKLDEVNPLRTLPVGMPSEVLLSRPDILQLEHSLIAANANIGVARASFFPSISLTATTGTASADFSNLFDGGTGMWNFMPTLNLPIFSGGRNVANLRVSEADKSIAIANYEKGIQKAFQEVADALVQRSTLEDQLTAQRSLLEAATETYRLSDARYNRGVDSYLGVLDSQRFMYSAQLALVAVRLSRDTNLIMLYKSLGGGWNENDVTPQANEETKKE